MLKIPAGPREAMLVTEEPCPISAPGAAWQTLVLESLTPYGQAFTAVYEPEDLLHYIRSAGFMMALGFTDDPVTGTVVIFSTSDHRAQEHMALLGDVAEEARSSSGPWAISQELVNALAKLPRRAAPFSQLSRRATMIGEHQAGATNAQLAINFKSSAKSTSN